MTARPPAAALARKPVRRLSWMARQGSRDLTTPEVAELLGVSAARVRQFILDDRLRARRVGRDWLIRRADADRFARQPRPRTGRPRKVLAES